MAANAPDALPATSARAMPEELDSGHLVRRLVALAVLLGLVAAAVSSLPGLGTLRQRFAHADLAFLAIIGLAKLASCLSNVVAFRGVFCPRMSWRFSTQLSLAEQATNVLVPTGGAGDWPWGCGFAPGRHVDGAHRPAQHHLLRAHQHPQLRGGRGAGPAVVDRMVPRSCPGGADDRSVGSGLGGGGCRRVAAAVAGSRRPRERRRRPCGQAAGGGGHAQPRDP